MAGGTRDIRQLMFRGRSYTPIPFLVIMVVKAEPTLLSICVGLLVAMLGEGIRFWGVSIAGSETRTTGDVGGTYLITTGPFAYVRNPLYLGNMVLYAGVGLMSMSLFPWLPIIALGWFYVQYFMIVTREEEFLAQKFGPAYTDYAENVRRFLPRLTPYASPDPAPKRLSTKEGLASERRTLQAMGLVTALIVLLYVVQRWRS